MENSGRETPLTGSPSAAMDRVIEVYLRDVDRSLLRENLRKTPEERVLALMALQRLAREAQKAGERLRGH